MYNWFSVNDVVAKFRSQSAMNKESAKVYNVYMYMYMYNSFVMHTCTCIFIVHVPVCIQYIQCAHLHMHGKKED